jgi:hypothetical protein
MHKARWARNGCDGRSASWATAAALEHSTCDRTTDDDRTDTDQHHVSVMAASPRSIESARIQGCVGLLHIEDGIAIDAASAACTKCNIY